jgi:hypothetical protein
MPRVAVRMSREMHGFGLAVAETNHRMFPVTDMITEVLEQDL